MEAVEELSAKAVQGPALPLQSIDDVHGSDSLPLGMLGVGDGIPDDVLEEDLENSTGLLVDESGDTLDSTTTRQPSDGGLGDALDVVSQHLTVTLGASLSQSLSSFATSSHVADVSMNDARHSQLPGLYRESRPMVSGGAGPVGLAGRTRDVLAPIFVSGASVAPWDCWTRVNISATHTAGTISII